MKSGECPLDSVAHPTNAVGDERGTTQFGTAPRLSRGPGLLGQTAAAAIAKDLRPDRAGAAVEEQTLHRIAQETGRLIREPDWQSHKLVSSQTAEHQSRFRASDFRAVKKTWPGTYGFNPCNVSGNWKSAPATPSEYLTRMVLQNELFADAIELEGCMSSSGPSLIIGAPPGGLSLVISQPWLEAADNAHQFPSQDEIKALIGAMDFRPIFASLCGWEGETNPLIILTPNPTTSSKPSTGCCPSIC